MEFVLPCLCVPRGLPRLRARATSARGMQSKLRKRLPLAERRLAGKEHGRGQGARWPGSVGARESDLRKSGKQKTSESSDEPSST